MKAARGAAYFFEGILVTTYLVRSHLLQLVPAEPGWEQVSLPPGPRRRVATCDAPQRVGAGGSFSRTGRDLELFTKFSSGMLYHTADAGDSSIIGNLSFLASFS